MHYSEQCRRHYDAPAITNRGTVEAVTRRHMVSGEEPDLSGQYPAGSIGFGI